MHRHHHHHHRLWFLKLVLKLVLKLLPWHLVTCAASLYYPLAVQRRKGKRGLFLGVDGCLFGYLPRKYDNVVFLITCMHTWCCPHRYGNVSDPFGRGNSVLAWNRELKKHIGVGAYDNGYEDNRIFNNGLSDEAGAGANVGFASVVGGTAIPAQVSKLDKYITTTVYGVKKGLPFGASLQCVDGAASKENPSCGPPEAVGPTADGVMASMFWVPDSATEPKMPGYDYNPQWFCDRDTPKDCEPGWPGWRWDQARSASLGRAYNYAHVSATYLGMYQAAEYDEQNTTMPRLWYLIRAYKTIVAMAYQASWYSHQGLMDGTNFRTVLYALRDEGMTAEFKHVEDIMRNRTLVGITNQCRYYVVNNKIYDLGNDKPGCHWYLASNVTTPWAKQTGLPGAGSEFAWDTTGQEEAYIWGDYFNSSHLAASALNQILAYTPLVPNWGYVHVATLSLLFPNRLRVRGRLWRRWRRWLWWWQWRLLKHAMHCRSQIPWLCLRLRRLWQQRLLPSRWA